MIDGKFSGANEFQSETNWNKLFILSLVIELSTKFHSVLYFHYYYIITTYVVLL